MKPFTTPLRLLTLPSWLTPRRAASRREPELLTEFRPDTEPDAAAAGGVRPGQPAPQSRFDIEQALDAGARRTFPPRGESEVMGGR